MSGAIEDQEFLQVEVADLERRLENARLRLTLATAAEQSSRDPTTALHTLLLLSDSALPLGSFAFSSGLESFLAHHRSPSPSASQLPSFNRFLDLSLSTLASTALPYVLTAYRNPSRIEDLDNDFDASTPCTVARRASVAQGRALLAVWDRSFKSHYAASPASATATQALKDFQLLLRTESGASDLPPNAHLAPLWGLLTRILQLPLHDAAYLFLFSHVRTVTSAGVRASVLGPYQAQAVLASRELQGRIRSLVEDAWEVKVEDAGQVVPVMDLWVGRHEKLYSRIFNS